MAIFSLCPQLCHCLACLHGGKEKVIFFSLCMKTGWDIYSFHVWEDDNDNDQEFEMITSNVFLVWPTWLGTDVLGCSKV